MALHKLNSVISEIVDEKLRWHIYKAYGGYHEAFLFYAALKDVLCCSYSFSTRVNLLW